MYAVDRVNSTMYGKFSVGYKIISEKATVIPQFQQTPVEDGMGLIMRIFCLGLLT